MREYTVFNVAQADNLELPPSDDAPFPMEQPLSVRLAEEIIGRMPNPPRLAWSHNQALYRPATDVIEMPPPAQFRDNADLHATFFHELAHATGHHSRLNRFELTTIGESLHNRAAEELTAELAAAMLAAHFGIKAPEENKNSAAYIASWRKHLTEHPGHLITAAQQAQKVFDLLTINPDDAVC